MALGNLSPDQVKIVELGSGPVLLLLAALIGLAIWKERRRRVRQRALEARELAVIIEEVATTGGGNISFAMLVLTVLGSIAVFGGAKTVFQEIAAGVLLIAGAILFGLGVALGRTRTYRIYRSEHRDPL